jgi:hypothetical protein
MHQPGSADYGIHRADCDAQCASDAVRFDNTSDQRWLFNATSVIQRQYFTSQQLGQCNDSLLATRGAAVDPIKMIRRTAKAFFITAPKFTERFLTVRTGLRQAVLPR